jgi:hypothetical protein
MKTGTQVAMRLERKPSIVAHARGVVYMLKAESVLAATVWCE